MRWIPAESACCCLVNMMLKLLYVDYRFLHSRIFVAWRKAYSFDTVVILNDTVAKNPMKQAIYQSILPEGMTLLCLRLQDYETVLQEKQCFWILETLKDAYWLTKRLDNQTVINIAAQRQQEVTGNADILAALSKAGVSVTFKQVPDEGSENYGRS